MLNSMKPLEFVGLSLDDLESFPQTPGVPRGSSWMLFSEGWSLLIGNP